MSAIKLFLAKVLTVLTASLFALLTIVVVWQVFARQVLNQAPAWTQELSQYLFVWTSMIGIALVFGERGHMAVAFAVERLPRNLRKIIAVFIQICIFVFAVVLMGLGGYRAAMNAWLQNSVALPTNIGPVYLIMPVAGAFIAFFALVNALEDLRGTGPLTVEDPTEDPEITKALADADTIKAEVAAQDTNKVDELNPSATPSNEQER
ncbi:MAG: TRAP transporter small permease [Actinomycetaceae bacterium]|nr:TRAP transporter small permease [Actinomycetaceae bacterium]